MFLNSSFILALYMKICKLSYMTKSIGRWGSNSVCLYGKRTLSTHLFIQCFKRVTRLAVIAILPCGPLCKHIYIYTSNIITS